MPVVDLILRGKPYRVTCDPGQEADVRRLAAILSGRMEKLGGKAFGGSDADVMLLAALTLTDEMIRAEADAKAEIQRLQAALTEAKAMAERDEAILLAAVDHLTRRLQDMAERIDPE